MGVVINADGIEVKYGPADGFDTIANLPYGAEVQVLAEAHMDDYKYGGWLYVRIETDLCTDNQYLTDGNCEGWIPKGALWHTNDPEDVQINLIPELVHTHVCSTEAVNVYPLPSVKSFTVGTLEPNQNVPVIRAFNGWFQVYINEQGDTGWIDSISVLCEGYVTYQDNFCGTGSIGYPYESEKPYSPDWGGFRSGTRPDHNGIDLGGAHGEPIIAAGSGSVSGYSEYGVPGGASKFVKINHDALGIQTGYWHLSGVADTVKDGWVEKGEVIGFTGNTGNVYCYVNGGWARPGAPGTGATCGTHLHFYVWDYAKGDYANPWAYIGTDAGGSCEIPDENNSGSIPGCGSDDEDAVCQAYTKDNPWGSLTSEDLGTPTIEIDAIYYQNLGTVKVWKKVYNLPEPRITYVETLNDELHVYGVGLQKYDTADMEVNYIECKKYYFSGGCDPDDTIYEHTYKSEVDLPDNKLDHVGLALFEKEGWLINFDGDQEIGWLWQDGDSRQQEDGVSYPDGRWKITLKLNDKNNHDININDEIYARSRVWDTTGVDGQIISTLIDYTKNNKYMQSGKSNVKKIDYGDVLYDVPIIREDVCDLPKYENQNLYGTPDSDNCGTLCGYGLAGCHIIAAAMVSSYFENGNFPIDLLEFSSATGNTGCHILWKDVKGVDHKGFIDLYNDSSTKLDYVYYPNSFVETKFNDKESEIDNKLFKGEIPVIQVFYGKKGQVESRDPNDDKGG